MSKRSPHYLPPAIPQVPTTVREFLAECERLQSRLAETQARLRELEDDITALRQAAS